MSFNLKNSKFYSSIPFLKDEKGIPINTINSIGQFDYYYFNHEFFLGKDSDESSNENYIFILFDRENKILFLSNIYDKNLHSCGICSVSDDNKDFVLNLDSSNKILGENLKNGQRIIENYERYLHKNNKLSNLINLNDESVEIVLNKFLDYIESQNISKKELLCNKFGSVTPYVFERN